MGEIYCGLCGAPILLDVAIVGKSEDGEFCSEEIHPCSNKGCGLLHSKTGEVMTMDGDLLFFVDKDDKVSLPGKEKRYLM